MSRDTTSRNMITVYDKQTGSDRSEKVKQLEAVFMSQQLFYTRIRESNENAIKASYDVSRLIAKDCKNLLPKVNLSNTVIKMADNMCLPKFA